MSFFYCLLVESGVVWKCFIKQTMHLAALGSFDSRDHNRFSHCFAASMMQATNDVRYNITPSWQVEFFLHRPARIRNLIIIFFFSSWSDSLFITFFIYYFQIQQNQSTSKLQTRCSSTSHSPLSPSSSRPSLSSTLLLSRTMTA
jgi:hypothetical protein